MGKKALVASVMTALFIGASGVAGASPIFHDTFDNENGGLESLNYTSFANWSVPAVSGTVDVIGNGGTFDFLPGHGLYVDLDGSTGAPGLLLSKSISAPAGDYILKFDLAGSHRGTTESIYSLLLNLGTFTKVMNIPSDQDFTTYELPFSLTGPETFNIAFQSIGGYGDNIGALLDNVSVDPVPEPSTLLLFASGFLGVAIYRKRQQSKDIA